MNPQTVGARCPECGRHPRLRVFPALVELASRAAPAAPLVSYQCKCGRVYPIAAGNLRQAA